MSTRAPAKKKKDLTDATYLDRFGVECARKIAPEMREGAREFGLPLPLDDLRVNHFIDRTIRIMDGVKKLNWDRTTTDRRNVFILAMFTELQRLGIA
jgi:hypothetical protein